MATFNPEEWARTQPHAFYSRWPVATRTRCDFCGVYYPEHQAAPLEELDVARHATAVVPGGVLPGWRQAATLEERATVVRAAAEDHMALSPHHLICAGCGEPGDTRDPVVVQFHMLCSWHPEGMYTARELAAMAEPAPERLVGAPDRVVRRPITGRVVS